MCVSVSNGCGSSDALKTTPPRKSSGCSTNVCANDTSSNCSARTPISTPSWAKKKPTRHRAGTSTSTCSTGIDTRIDAAQNVSVDTSIPRTNPPSENASSSSTGEAGEDSWSSMARWNFCCRIDDELLENAFIAQAIMIRPGTTNTT